MLNVRSLRLPGHPSACSNQLLLPSGLQPLHNHEVVMRLNDNTADRAAKQLLTVTLHAIWAMLCALHCCRAYLHIFSSIEETPSMYMAKNTETSASPARCGVSRQCVHHTAFQGNVCTLECTSPWKPIWCSQRSCLQVAAECLQQQSCLSKPTNRSYYGALIVHGHDCNAMQHTQVIP